MSARPDHLIHPALEDPSGVLLAEAEVSDRKRVGVLLQGAAVLAHLETAGGCLARGWRGTALDPEGRLRSVRPAAGRSRRMPQELLRELVGLLFGTRGRVPGRGEARRAVRRLLERWRHDLAPIPPHRAVTEILELAPFLWAADHAVDRRALVAELVVPDGAVSLLAGSGAGGWPRAVHGRSAEALRDLVAGPDARVLWLGKADADPGCLAAAGRWRSATAAWSLRRPTGERERLAHGESLLAEGRFVAAVQVLGELSSDARDRGVRLWAEAFRLRARLLLGELGAVRRRLGALASKPVPQEVLVELADVAQRVYANSHRPERARRWVDRALREARGSARPAAHVLAAEAAWDRGDIVAMERHLEAARPAAESSPDVAWHWHQVAGWRALAEGRTGEMVACLTRALTVQRRRLHRSQAAGLWNDLGVARVRDADLAGAERAFLHAWRLLAGCDGPRRATLALHNLAEVRLRRGRLMGVHDILERSLEENLVEGNVRGQLYDLALWARYELVLGRSEAAVNLCGEALEIMERRGLDWYRSEIRLFQARALGWLGERRGAAAALEDVAPEALVELDPEERPAVFALAGQRDQAWRTARGSRFEELWSALLEGREPPVRIWSVLDELEPYRAARCVYDAELLHPGVAPAPWRRRAVAALRRLGATGPAERLERTTAGAWRALTEYLGGGLRDFADLRRLFVEAGHPELRLERCSETGEREVLVGGEGGPEELSTPLACGRLVLRAPVVDDTVRALFALALRDLDRDRPGLVDLPVRELAARRTPASRDGLVGESPVFRRALERADRLASGDAPVLVLGESGTGKELVARRIHRLSSRSGASLVAINCAALSESLLLSDLFGHVRGSFTGADRDRAGVFETAQGGTVFLDEIGDLPASAQGMLLRVLQEGEVRRVGESLPRTVDARVVAATHRDLVSMVEAGSFRQDLFYRLNVARVELPALRDRGEDVVLLAEHFLAGSGGRGGPRLSGAARARLLSHSWPGNVRELQNVLQVATALAEDGTIAPEHLEISGNTPETRGDYHARVDAFRRRLLLEALEASGGNRAEAARRLGLTRQALSYLTKQLRLP
ncbi:MAG: sigma 54-interacting transcriptional regulator [Thermoanaerobaculia bacterium]